MVALKLSQYLTRVGAGCSYIQELEPSLDVEEKSIGTFVSRYMIFFSKLHIFAVLLDYCQMSNLLNLYKIQLEYVTDFCFLFVIYCITWIASAVKHFQKGI